MRGAPGFFHRVVVPVVTLVLVVAFVSCGSSLPDGDAQADSADAGSDGAVDSALDIKSEAPTDATLDSNHGDVEPVPEGGGDAAGSLDGATGDGAGGVGTTCGSTADCQAGLLCCYPCGVPDCHDVCAATGDSGCPLLP